MSSVPPVHTLIWLSVKPILKLAFTASAGIIMTKAGLFPMSGSRAASQIILNVTLPALLFAKIVPSLNSENIAAIGPIVLVGLVYIGLSLIFGVIIRSAFRCPPNFRWGIIACSGWSNWGDLPTSVVQTVCASAPFSGQDSDLAVAYVAIFILVFYVTLFPCRGTKLIEMDYTHPPKEIDLETADALQRGRWWRVKESRIGQFVRRRGASPPPLPQEVAGDEKNDALPFDVIPEVSTNRNAHVAPIGRGMDEIRRIPTTRSVKTPSLREMAGAAVAAPVQDTSQHNRRSVRYQQRLAEEQRTRLQTIEGSRANSRANSVFEGASSDGSVADGDDITEEVGGTLSTKVPDAERSGDEEAQAPVARWRRILISVKDFALSLLTPPTIALISGIIIALVKDLKALFVHVPGNSFNPVAPDGDPPLGIILDTATFIGNASVPLGLMVLGSALARMRLPRPLSRLPLASIISIALAKLVLLPIVGFLIVEGLTNHTSLISRDNTVLRFVMIFFSVVPTATTQVALTQILAPEDGESNSDILAAYLIVQYIIFAFSSVVLISFTLSTLF